MRSLRERLNAIRQRNNALRNDLDRIESDIAAGQTKNANRVAKISGSPSGSDNTYAVTFLDGTFTETAGNQTPTYSDRQATAKGVAHNITTPTTAPVANDKILIHRYSDRWWFNKTG